MTQWIGANFLTQLIKAVPYKVYIFLTDNGIQFTNRAQDRYTGRHPFQGVCVAHGIAHRLRQGGLTWTNGQVEQMNGLLKIATVKRYNYARDQRLKEDLRFAWLCDGLQSCQETQVPQRSYTI